MRKVLFWGLIAFTTALPFVLDIFVFTDKVYTFLYSILIIPGLLITLNYPSWAYATFIILILSGCQITIYYYAHYFRIHLSDLLTRILFSVVINATTLITATHLGIKNSKLMSELNTLATIDPLTGVNNRRYFETSIEKVLQSALNNGNPFLLIALDIDHFKQINDKFGHLCGDFVLQELVNVIEKTLRGTDQIIRFGGEEFMILLPRTRLDEGVHIGERILKAVEKAFFVYQDNQINITISLGLASFSGESTQELIEKADRALYQAKENGRNQLIVA